MIKPVEVKINQTPEGENFIEYCPVHEIYEKIMQSIIETKWMFKIKEIRKVTCSACQLLINQ